MSSLSMSHLATGESQKEANHQGEPENQSELKSELMLISSTTPFFLPCLCCFKGETGVLALKKLSREGLGLGPP